MKLKMNRKTINSIMMGVLALLTVLLLIVGGFLKTNTAGAEEGLTVTEIDPEGIGLTEKEPEDQTEEPSADPTEEPAEPTEIPIEGPINPEETPTVEPEQPTEQPTEEPTAEPTQQPVPTDPVDMKTLFKIEIVTPKDWTSAKARNVRVKVWQLTDITWARAQYKLNGSDWTVIKDKFTLQDGYYYVDLEMTDNALLTVRLNIESGVFMDEKKEINIFDRTAPVVTAGFNDMLLHVEALDDQSGTAGAQVNGLLFTTLENGKLDVRMEDVLLTYKQLAIRAYDYAGNFSDPVVLDNPYYVTPTATPKPTAQPTVTTEPTATPKSTKKPTGGSSVTATPETTREPVTVVTPESSTTPDYSQYQYYPYATAEPVVIVITPEPVVTPEPEVRTEYVPIGPGQPFTSSGNMQTLDVLYSAATNKQFITVQSRNGQTYYLVIDYDKPIDEENELYETYFLNLVDDRDLISVLSDKEIIATPTPEIIYVTPEPTTPPQPTAVPTQVPAEPEKKDQSQTAMLALIALLAIGGGAAFFFLKKKKAGAPRGRMLDESSFDDDEDEEDPEESEEEDKSDEK